MAIDFNHLLSNTLLSVTVLLSLVGWVIAFGAACAIGTFLAANVATTWWVIIFELILNVGIIYLIVSGTLPMYRLVVGSRYVSVESCLDVSCNFLFANFRF
jgi:hypothetical protein